MWLGESFQSTIAFKNVFWFQTQVKKKKFSEDFISVQHKFQITQCIIVMITWLSM